MNDTIIAALIGAFVPSIFLIVNTFLIQRLKKETDAIKLLTLKALIINEGLPLQERLAVYREYKRLGGNSWVDVYYDLKLKTAIVNEIDALGGRA